MYTHLHQDESAGDVLTTAKPRQEIRHREDTTAGKTASSLVECMYKLDYSFPSMDRFGSIVIGSVCAYNSKTIHQM